MKLKLLDRRTCLVAFSMLVLFWVFEARADQNNPDLDFLFAALLKVEDPELGNLITDAIWKRWLLVDNSEVTNLLLAGINQMRHNNLFVALELFHKIVERDPKFAEGWNKRATVYYLLGDHENSISDIQQTLHLEPRHFGAMAGLARICLEQGNHEMAEGVLKKALSLNPFLIDARRNLRVLEKWKDKQKIKFPSNGKEKIRGRSTMTYKKHLESRDRP